MINSWPILFHLYLRLPQPTSCPTIGTFRRKSRHHVISRTDIHISNFFNIGLRWTSRPLLSYLRGIRRLRKNAPSLRIHFGNHCRGSGNPRTHPGTLSVKPLACRTPSLPRKTVLSVLGSASGSFARHLLSWFICNSSLLSSWGCAGLSLVKTKEAKGRAAALQILPV